MNRKLSSKGSIHTAPDADTLLRHQGCLPGCLHQHSEIHYPSDKPTMLHLPRHIVQVYLVAMHVALMNELNLEKKK
jgi:hypothetical protein